MHKIKVHEDKFTCDCGLTHKTNTGAEAQRLAYQHARANAPAFVTDMRLCSNNCKQTRAQLNCPDHWHHLNCENRMMTALDIQAITNQNSSERNNNV